MATLYKTRGRVGIGLALVMLALVAGIWWMRHAPTVDVVQVQALPLVRSLQFSARVAVPSKVDVGSTVTGRVERVLVAEGAQVSAGAVLVQLEASELRAAVAQALAGQQQAQARLAGLRSSGRSAVVAALAQAQASADAAEAEFARVKQLVAQQFLSPSRLDDARRARDVAAAQVAGAQAQAEAIGDAGTEVAQARAQLALATSATEVARSRLAQAQLRAPTDAQVLSRLVEPGQIVQPGRALLVLALAGPTQISALVDERFLDQLALGQVATAVADAYADQRFAARLMSISPAVDTQRGSIEVKFSLPDAPPAFLRQDMTLSVEVETARREHALVLPVAALNTGVDAASVLVARDGVVEKRSVRLGLRTLDAVEVIEGLRAGELVLLERLIKPGASVRTRVVEQALVTTPARAGSRGADGAAALTNMMGR